MVAFSKTMKLGLMAAAFALAAPAAAVENVAVTFTAPNGGQSVGLYSGVVTLRVSGTGFSLGSRINDAFYDVANQTLNTGYYALGFDTVPLAAFNPSRNVQNFLVGSVPAFNPANIYTFKINVGPTPSTLYFGVMDGQFADNGGRFDISIAVPEPQSWALMIAGFGLVGAAM
ncbi:PEPxxWA-CTERM sorting domain-containing protein, partial [Sandarakinorhabdus sp.]|uniref:PEPxxWA-CTERM sorting domain-containing protein n=1 Tax=Sandarakinorhabdus sp. TaxID=1916663 RepID=UPI00286E2F40